MLSEHFWLTFVLVGFAGLGLGFGLVLGAFVARSLRRYMTGEGFHPYGDDHDRDRRPPT